MKVSCVQMNMRLGDPAYNYHHAEELIRQAAGEQPDLILLPETWNTGFFPKDHLEDLADNDLEETDRRIGKLAEELKVTILAGSVANRRGNHIYNTAAVYSPEGKRISSYNKVHLFSPMGEHKSFTPGGEPGRFEAAGVKCGLMICYDLRFPEWTRKLALEGIDILFVVSQWPDIRIPHLKTLAKARAIENQIFVVCCNSCGRAESTQYGGCSSMIDPWGEELAAAGAEEEIITAKLNLGVLNEIRSSINVFADRRPSLYAKGSAETGRLQQK